MPDWWAFCGVARRLGFQSAFDYASPAAILREHAALSGLQNDGTRDFDFSALADISDRDYQAFAPFQWPWRAGETATLAPKRMFADGRFVTPDGRARIVATPFRGLAGRKGCLLYTSDAADERSSVDLGGRRIIKKKHKHHTILCGLCVEK